MNPNKFISHQLDSLIENMKNLSSSFKKENPPPYDFPSVEGKTIYILEYALNELIKLKN